MIIYIEIPENIKKSPETNTFLGYKVNIQNRFLSFLFLMILFIFRERGKKEKERKRNINVWLPFVPFLLGTWPTTQACALRIEPATLWFAGQHSVH